MHVVRFDVALAVSTVLCACACARGDTPAPVASPAAKPAEPAASACAADELPPLDMNMKKMYRDCRSTEEACRAACDRDEVDACFGLALAEEERARASGVTDDRAAPANALYRKACSLGAANACTNHAAHLWAFSESRADLACAVRLFEATCEVDDHFGCGMAGRILLDHAEGPDDEDVSRARALLERSCAQLGGFPCRILALNLERGRLGPVPDGRVVELMRRACDGGDHGACGAHATVEESFGP